MFDELQLQIYSFLTIEDLLRFDTALCCKESRAVFLALMQEHKFWQFSDFSHNDKDFQSVSWMAKRNVDLPKGPVRHFLSYFPFKNGSLLFAVLASTRGDLKEVDKLQIVKYLVEKTDESLEYVDIAHGATKQHLIQSVISKKYESIFDFIIERLSTIQIHYESGSQTHGSIRSDPLLLTAAIANSTHMVTRLLELGAHVDDYYHDTEGGILKNELAVKNNITHFGTALTNSIMQKSRGITEVLLNAGADIERKVRIKKLPSPLKFHISRYHVFVSPLAFACNNGDTGMMRYLMERGASIHGVAYMPWTGNNGLVDMDTIDRSINMLTIAIDSYSNTTSVDMVTEAIAVLIANPKNEEFTSYEYFVAMNYALMRRLIPVMMQILSLCPNQIKEEVLHRKGEGESTLLMSACSCGQTEAILELLKAGSDPNILDDSGYSSLQRYMNSFTAVNNIHPATSTTEEGYRRSSEVLKQMIAAGADVSRLDLNNATLCNQLKIVSMCCENGISPNMQSSQGNSAVHTACLAGKSEILEVILKYGGDPYLKNTKGESPLHLAIRHDRTDCFKIIMRSIDTLPNDNGLDEKALLAILKEAAEYGSATVLDELLRKSKISREQLNHLYTRTVSLREAMDVIIKASRNPTYPIRDSYVKKEKIFKKRGAVLTIESNKGMLMANDKGVIMPVQQAISQECCIS